MAKLEKFETRTRRKLETVKAKVLSLLEEYPETRNDDRYLFVLYWRTVDQIKEGSGAIIPFIPFSEINRATTPETITRVRRKIQEQGKYLPTDVKVLEMRLKRSKAMRKMMLAFSIDNLVKLTDISKTELAQILKKRGHTET